MTEIWLVRHGQTDWNLERRFQGQTDIPLNLKGLQQAELLACKLNQETFDAIYSSDLQRASQTAECVARTLKMPVLYDSRLREICQGEWEGMSLDEVIGRYKVDPTAENRDPVHSRAPGGESVAEVAARMSEAANSIACGHPRGKVLIVSHGVSVAALFCAANKIPMERHHEYIPDNTDVLVIRWNGKTNLEQFS